VKAFWSLRPQSEETHCEEKKEKQKNSALQKNNLREMRDCGDCLPSAPQSLSTGPIAAGSANIRPN
jgi:hypothetical protein